MKKYHSGEKLQNRELNLVLRNAERGAVSNEAVFTLYNVCSVHRGMVSTSGGVQYIGGIP